MRLWHLFMFSGINFDRFCRGWYFQKRSLPALMRGWCFGDSGLSLNLTPVLGPTGWDLRADPTRGLDRGIRGNCTFAVLSSTLFPSCLTLSSTCPVLSQTGQVPLRARTACPQCLAELSKDNTFSHSRCRCDAHAYWRVRVVRPCLMYNPLPCLAGPSPHSC